jgi:hypothetical protein
VLALEDYGAMIERLCAGRPTLVHASYRPKDVLVDSSAAPVRICAVD